MGRNKKTCTDKFRIKCLTEMMEGKSLGEVAAANDVATSTLSDWKKAFSEGKMYSDSNKDRKEKEEYKEKYLKAIEVIGKKEMEIELLKKEQRF